MSEFADYSQTLSTDQLLSPDAAAIAYVKKTVGLGDVYENDVSRAVFSDRGAYYELKGMPSEFSGALGGAVDRRMISRSQAQQVVSVIAEAIAAMEDGAQFSLIVLSAGWDVATGEGMYVYDRRAGSEPLETGRLLREPLPLFFKFSVVTAGRNAGLGALLEAVGAPADALGLVLFGIAPDRTDDGHYVIGHFVRSGATVDLSAGARAASPAGLMPQ
jgi:hypothetical protein